MSHMPPRSPVCILAPDEHVDIWATCIRAASPKVEVVVYHSPSSKHLEHELQEVYDVTCGDTCFTCDVLVSHLDEPSVER